MADGTMRGGKMSDPLSPARGILWGILIGAMAWATAILLATWLVGR